MKSDFWRAALVTAALCLLGLSVAFVAQRRPDARLDGQQRQAVVDGLLRGPCPAGLESLPLPRRQELVDALLNERPLPAWLKVEPGGRLSVRE